MAHDTDWGLVLLNLASAIKSVSQTCAVCASFFSSAKWVEEPLPHLAVVVPYAARLPPCPVRVCARSFFLAADLDSLRSLHVISLA